MPSKIDDELYWLKTRNHVGGCARHTQKHEMCVPTQILLLSFEIQENTFIPRHINLFL